MRYLQKITPEEASNAQLYTVPRFCGQLQLKDLKGKPQNSAMHISTNTHPGVGCKIAEKSIISYKPSVLPVNNCDSRYNEPLRLAERKLVFNLDALYTAISKSVARSSEDIVAFTKIAEGGSFRVFEATFRCGVKVIARLPYPSTIPRGHGVASEVATMDFLRLHGLPIPKVYGWDSSAANPVGAEYMIMEMVGGTVLDDRWYTMTLSDRMALIENIVNLERALFNIPFPASGSLYFKGSLEAGTRAVPVLGKHGERFCIGSSTEYLWWYQMRNELDVNHGPWERTEDLLVAVGKRENEWLRKFGGMRYPREPLYREFYNRQMVDPQVQQTSLDDYLSVVPHLAPQQAELNLPTMRHPDLSPSNIFINDSNEITGIIDWQHATVLPLFLQAKIPKHFQNYGDDDSKNFRPPKLPSDFSTLPDAEKDREWEVYRRRQVHYFYLGYTSRYNKKHFNAMAKHEIVLRNRLYDVAGRPWEGDNTSLKAEMIRFLQQWPSIGEGSSRPPVNYLESDMQVILDRAAKQKEADVQVQKLRDFIGINIEGWIPTDGYLDAKEKAEYLKVQMMEAADTQAEREEVDSLWQFQDHEEID